MKINANINLFFNTKLESDWEYTSAVITNIEENKNKVVLTIQVTFIWEDLDLKMVFEYIQTINKKDILNAYNNGENIIFKPDKPGKFIKCNLNPNNDYDVFRILEYCTDSCSMGYDLSSEWTEVLPAAHALQEFIDIVNKTCNTSFNITTDINEVLQVAEDNDIIEYGYIREDDSFIYNDELDKNLAEKLFSKIKNYVKDNFKPHDGDGLISDVTLELVVNDYELY